jgi:uncharacterized protein YgiM (DUF1202 family)
MERLRTGRRGNVWVLGALLSLAAAPAFVEAAAGDRDAAQIERDDTAITEGRGRGARLGRADAGQVYAVVGRADGWVQIQFARSRGWVRRDRVRMVSRAVHTVVAKSLNVRAGSAPRFAKLGQLDAGAEVAVVGADGDWKKIFFRGRVAWINDTYLAKGDLDTSRSGAGFIQLPASGAGFYSYSVPGDRWGRPALVYALERAGLRLRDRGRPRFGVGDLSLRNGGDIAGHSSHERGEDVDILPMRKRGEGSVTRFQSAYSRPRTADLIREIRSQVPTELVLFNDSGIRGVQPWPGHDNHFHLRIR